MISRDDMEVIRNAVNESCSCGGRGPTDPEMCQACEVWWRIRYANTVDHSEATPHDAERLMRLRKR